MKEALVRMEDYRTMIQGQLTEYRLSQNLLAIPIIESGYRNLPQSKVESHGAGIWMFITKTAQNFGLRVEPAHRVDERLDIALETNAARTSHYISKPHECEPTQ